MARSRLFNPLPRVEFKHNPYQQAFLEARRLRRCAAGCADHGRALVWSILEHQNACPACGARGVRVYTRMQLRAGRQSGKTRVGALSIIEEFAVPDTKIWAAAPSIPELEDYVVPAFCSQFPQEWFDHPMIEWSEDRLTLTANFGTGLSSEIKFRSLDDPNRATGDTVDVIWMDEGRKIQELAYHLATAMTAVRNGLIFTTSSPDYGEDWCHRNFWLFAEAGTPGYWAATYKTTDSPVIDPAVIERARETMPASLFRREYEASIEYPSGTIYGDVIDQCEADDARMQQWIPEWPALDPRRPALIPMDPGADHPFAAVKIVPVPQGLCVVGEYEARNALYMVHAAALKQLAAPTTEVRWGIDSAARQSAIELMQHGIHAQGVEKDVAAGIQRVYAWMASDRMRIASSRCPLLLKRLRAYRYAELRETVKGQPIGVPFKKDDDLCDALRYGCMLWPELPARALDVSGLGPRNLDLLSAHHRREILLAADEPQVPEGELTRVTDELDESPQDYRVVDDRELQQFFE
jgi:hypothetical protein